MRIRTKLRISLFALYLVVICCISGNNFIDPFDSKPKIVVKDGHIVFETARDKNITFRSSGAGRITIDGQDLTRIAQLAQSGGLDGLAAGSPRLRQMEESVEQLRTQFATITNAINELRSLQTSLNDTTNKINQILGTGSNPMPANTARRYIKKVPRIENSLNRLTELLANNECSTNPCRNGGTCEDIYNGYICRCTQYWEGTNCDVDVNECQRFVGTDLGCQNGATCVNTPGGYNCLCTVNYYGLHCTTQHDDCSSATSAALCGHGMCLNQQRAAPGMPNYRCICEQGWTSTGHNPACNVDVDECADRQSHCSTNPAVTCINLPGNFYCGPCPPGYTGDGYRCHDINECEVNNGGCSQSPRVQCTNTIGSRICGQCPIGYNGNGIVCEFSGVCNNNNGGCHPSAQCFDNIRIGTSFRECRCPTGLVGNGVGPGGCVSPTGTTCSNNPCINGACVPSGDSFSCICRTGFTGSLCESEVNECLSNPCQNGGTCTDQQNGFLCLCTDQWQGTTCSEERQVCGGSFTTPFGSISFPSDPNAQYPHRVNCAWMVSTTVGQVLNVTFTSFSLEASTDCSADFLQIHDGPNAGAHNLGRFCGQISRLPNGGNIMTSQHQIYLWFKTDATVNHDGFRLQWNTTDPVCGGELNVTEYGSVNSPGYPGQYPHNRDCYWLVTVPYDKRIVFHFATLHIESHTTCNYDYVEVFDGSRDRDPQLGKFCTETAPAPLTTSGSQSLIHFHSDGSRSGNGFHITYASVPKIHGCGGTLTAPKGRLISPNFPDRYDHNVVCDWIIRVHPTERIQITFTVFDLENHRKCKWDYVEIRESDGNSVPNSESPLIARFCGQEMPRPVVSNTNSVWFRFRADQSLNGLGFRAQYITLCGGLYTDTEGTITSPFYPDPYPKDRKCQYHIVLPQGRLVQLGFQFFDVEGSLECAYDYLKVRESYENGTELGTFCGNELPDTITSKYNELWLEFATDGSVQNHGFVANYTDLDVGCGGVFTQNHGTISTPSQPDLIPPQALCSWLIRADPGFIIRLTFTVFVVEQSRNCTNDYIEVRDSNNAKIGRYCGTRIPPVLTSTGNQLFVIFKTNGQTSREGFAAAYSFLDSTTACGGNYFVDSGVVKSPGYPTKKYPNRLECAWMLQVENGRQIELNVTFFELERNCRFDYLAIHNGRDERSPLIGKFCGNTIPKTIRSHGHVMYLKFQTDSSQNYKGFEILYDTTTSGCGGTLTSQTGSFESPGYPEPYAHNAECVWLITVSKGSVVSLLFADVDIEAHATCRYDYLEVFDGTNDRSPSLGKYCSTRVNSHTVQSKSNVMFVKFKTDVSANGRGFRVNYHANCSTTVSGYRGVIESPNFPNLYNHNANCTWRIRAPRGNNITIAFSRLVLEPDLSCRYDYVQLLRVDSGATNSTEVAKYCGVSSQVPPPFNVTSSDAIIRFVTDRSQEHLGFRLEWMAVGCGGDFINKNTGELSSMGYPNGYPHGIECIWHIRSANRGSIRLTFVDFDLEGDSECNFDYVDIFGGPDETSPRLSHICHKAQNPQTVSSMGQSMTIKFRSDGSFRGKGFRATFASTGMSCSGLYTTEAATITSPNYPSTYEASDDCEYVIDVKGLHDIQITFEDFGMPSSVNCTASYLAIYDGPSSEDPLLLRHCGSGVPALNPLRSTGSKVYMRMKADGNAHGKGFKLSYKTMCGGRRTLASNEMGEITSPNYPTHSIVNPNCHWILIASQPGEHITLTFTHIDTYEVSQDCTNHYVEVRNGDSGGGSDLTASPLIGRYCGDRMPAPITSMGNALYISSSFGIFRATYATSTSFCGGEFTAVEGHFMSPDYPNSYPLESECVWVIRASPGNRVTFSFSAFNIESSEFCNSDYVELREQSSSGPLMGRYCGDRIPSLNYTSTNVLWVKFRSDQSGTAPGFRASYALEHGIALSGASGQITSPGYPRDLLRQNQEYSWTVVVGTNKYVSLTFAELAIPMTYNDRCNSYLVILDGITESAPELGQFCGYNTPDPITTNTNAVTVKLVKTTLAAKFSLLWNEINETEALLSRSRQVIALSNTSFDIVLNRTSSYVLTSPGYPTGYGPRLNYNWTFHTSLSYHFRVNISDLNLESHQYQSRCYYDLVKFLVPTRRDSSLWRENRTVCGRFNGSIEMPAFHKMRINFVTDGWNNKTGFRLIVSPTCGGTLYGHSYGYITTDDILGSLRCAWTIVVREGRTIRLSFEAINIADNNNCQFAYILLRNGHRKSSPILGRYCGRNTPTIPESASNRVRVEFYARSDLHADFRLRYDEVSVGCGGPIELTPNNNSLWITSPNWPQLPTHNLECDWVIMSPVNTDIRFDFDYSQTSSWRCNTTNEFVQIRDGGSEVSPVIGKYCVPPRMTNSIRSSDNFMFVRFVTSNSEELVTFRGNVRINDCGGSYVVPYYQEFNLPSYPNNYRDNTECVYFFRAYQSSGYYFQINITSLDIVGNPDDCSVGDYVEFREVNVTGNLIRRLCGTSEENSTILLRSERSVVYMIFKSDVSRTGKGIKFSLKSLWNRCGATIMDATNNGIITSPNHPNAYPNSAYCSWTIFAPPGRSIKLSFTDFNLKADPRNLTNCLDKLTLYKGSQLSHQLSPTCGATLPRPILMPNHVTRMMFRTSGLAYGEGFRLEYSADDEEVCGGLLSGTTGTISSYRFGESNFTDQIDCVWDLNIPFNSTNHTIAFVFDVFEIPAEPYCANNSLRLEYHSTNGKYFYPGQNRFCGNKTGGGKKFEFFALSASSHDLSYPRLFLSTNYSNGNRGMSGRYFIQECGGTFRNLEGEFTSPNYPNNYPVDTYCIWNFNFNYGTRLTLAFTEFNLDPDCQKDYIQVSQGWWEDAPISDRFCGSRAPPETHSSAMRMRVIFKGTGANRGDSARKFKFQIRTSEHICGGLLLNPSGSVESKSYPSRYENNVECVWTIQMPVGYHLNFTFVDRFDIENAPNCDLDYVLFQEQLNPELDEWTEFKRVCGITKPEPFKSRGNKVQVIFHTNAATTGDGFRLFYQLACGEVYTSPSGVIASPNYPDVYRNWVRCQYLILRNPKDYISIQFEDFDVESHPTCVWDAVDVYLGNSTASQRYGPYCGTEMPPSLTSMSSLLITFRSDGSVNKKGFKATFSITSCGGDLTDESGLITSPQRGTYSSNMDCVWLIRVRQNRVIEAKFTFIDLENCYNCYCDSVEMRDGLNSSAPLIGKYCRQDRDSGIVVRTKANTLWVRFKTNRAYERTGFGLGYRTTLGEAQGCGGVFANTSQGVIQSPDIDNDGKYESELNCWYHIIVPRDKVVKLTFQRMTIEQSPANTSRCSYDYLEIRDGISHKDSLIDRFCGTTLPEPIRASTNKLVLQFVSDGQQEMAGFKVRYEAVDRPCGGILNVTNETQIVQSPNYPNEYQPSLRCRWYFNLDRSVYDRSYYYYASIRLKFTDFDVNCNNGDSLEFNARTNSRTRIAPYQMCSSRTPPVISTRRGVFMTFISSSTPAVNHRGFKLSYTLSTCNQSYTEDSGIISNLNYPDFTYQRSACVVNITARVGQTISLYFNHFQMYTPSNRLGCPVNNMTIIDGQEPNSPVLATLCGNALPDPIFSTGNKLSIKVQSQSYYSKKYFMSYSTTSDGRGCGGNLTAFNGTFTSPLYPRPYNQVGQCRWLVHSFGLHSLTLRFTFFSLSSTIGCQTNYVEVYEGVTDLPTNRVQRYCGDDNPAPYQSRGNVLLVKLVTSANNTAPGFRAQYYFNSQELNATQPIVSADLSPHITDDGSVYFPSDGIMFRPHNG